MEKQIKSLVFEGQTLSLSEVLFRCPERGLTVVYTQNREYNIWLFDVGVEHSTFFFDNQKAALMALAEQPHVIDLYGEVRISEETLALVTEAVENDCLTSKMVETQIIDHDILTIGINACQVLCVLHEEGKVANFVHPDYIYPDKANNFKFANFTLAFDKEHVKDAHKNILASRLFAENRNFSLLTYTDYTNREEEILNLGLLLYQLCFGDTTLSRDPSDSRKLTFPDKPRHSFSIQSAIEECLVQKRDKRAKPIHILASFTNEQRLDLCDTNNSSDSTIMANISLHSLEKTPNSEGVKPKFLASVSWLFCKATTDTEGWFRSYVMENSSVPDEEFVNKILEKAWRKKEKVRKLYDIVDKYMDDQDVLKNSVIVAKLLLFLHSIMTKGPVDLMTEQVGESSKRTPGNMKIVVGSCSYLNFLLRRIRTQWDTIAKSGLKYKDDKLRSQGLSYLIFFYSIVLCEKSKFGLDYYKVFGGNFSVDPLLKSQEVREVFSQKTFADLHGYCSMLLRFFKLLPEDIGMKTLQFAVAKSITFEIHHLLGVFCYTVAVFKKVAFSFEQADKTAIKTIVKSIETSLDNCIIRFHYCLEDLKASSAFKIYADLLPQSSLTAMNEVKQVQPVTGSLDAFPIEDYFPVNVPIGSFEIPASYSANDSPSRIIGEEEKLAIIKRELIKSSKVAASQATSTQTVQVQLLNSSTKSSTVRRENIKPALTHSEKLVNDADSCEECAVQQGSQTGPLRSRLVNKKLPGQVQLVSIPRKGAEKNPYLNASESEQNDRLDEIIEDAKASSQSLEDNRAAQKKQDQGDDQNSNDGDGLDEKAYNKLDDSVEMDKQLEDGAGKVASKSDQKAFDASKAMKNEFFKLVPLAVAKEDKQIQCDLEKEESQPSSDRGFNLEKFMREEISNGRRGLSRHPGLDHQVQRPEVRQRDSQRQHLHSLGGRVSRIACW